MRKFRTLNGDTVEHWVEVTMTEWDRLSDSQREILMMDKEGTVFVRRAHGPEEVEEHGKAEENVGS